MPGDVASPDIGPSTVASAGGAMAWRWLTGVLLEATAGLGGLAAVKMPPGHRAADQRSAEAGDKSCLTGQGARGIADWTAARGQRWRTWQVLWLTGGWCRWRRSVSCRCHWRDWATGSGPADGGPGARGGAPSGRRRHRIGESSPGRRKIGTRRGCVGRCGCRRRLCRSGDRSRLRSLLGGTPIEKAPSEDGAQGSGDPNYFLLAARAACMKLS